MYSEYTSVSDNFILKEGSLSKSRPDLVEPIPAHLTRNFIQLVHSFLQPVRSWYKRVLVTTSGYRSVKLNRAIGGSDTSQHLLAQAVDWHMSGLKAVFEDLMRRRVPGIQWDRIGQVIYYPDERFVHVALRSERFPVPTFCLHWPSQGYKYYQLSDVDEFRQILADHH